jgi:hypothetical protein
MDYLDTLRCNGWLVDPGDRVRVVAIHAARCPARLGQRCRCEPRLALASNPFPREARERDVDLPTLEVAAGE